MDSKPLTVVGLSMSLPSGGRKARNQPAAPLDEAAGRSVRYLACTLDVMEAITPDAILNCSVRLVIPCRRAIQSKSV